MDIKHTDCKQIEESLDAFHDGELSASEQASVEAHLQNCGICASKLAEINRLVHTLKTMPAASPPASLSDKLDSLIDKQHKVASFRRRALVPLSVAAAVAAIVIGLGSGLPGEHHVGTPVATLPAERVSTSPSMPAPESSNNGQHRVSTEPALASSGIAEPMSNRSAAKHSATTVAAVPEDKTPLAVTNPDIAHTPQSKPVIDRASDSTTIVDSPYDEEVLAEMPTLTDSFTEAVGFAIDEDGLYDLKM